jgi:hypothetical protein
MGAIYDCEVKTLMTDAPEATMFLAKTPPLPADLFPSPRRDLRRFGTRAAIAAGCLVALVLVTLFPLALRELGGMSWSRLSDIGQAYGALAAALTALTLGAVAVSVLLQARDARIAQEHGTRMLHLELVQMLIEDPRLGVGRLASKRETRRQRYVNLWLMLWKTMYRLGDMTENDLRLTLRRELFSNSPDTFGQRFWQRSREAFRTNIKGRREQRFFAIVDDEYQRSRKEVTRSHPRTRLRRTGQGLRSRAEPLVAGGVIGTVAGCVLALPMVRRRRTS